MLILTRRPDESIVIGEGENKITVRILAVHGRYVKIGIEAPKDMPIYREEIYEKIYSDSDGNKSGKKILIRSIGRHDEIVL